MPSFFCARIPSTDPSGFLRLAKHGSRQWGEDRKEWPVSLRNMVEKETQEQKRRVVGKLPGRQALDPEHLGANVASAPRGKLLTLSQPQLSHLKWGGDQVPPEQVEG